MLADLQQGQGTAGKLLKDPQVYDEAQQTLAEMRKLTQDLNAGKGTAGKLLKDDQLYKQFTELTAKLDTTIDRINSGQGTVGQLLVNPQMYEAMNGAMREFQALAKDIRANPKKFLRIKLAIF
jgi:phospholipid/cholesterol/gamma-HCH transport system substrate-binding protein